MVANFGYGVLILAFFVTLYGAGAALFGAKTQDPRWIKSARSAMLLTFPLVTLSVISLLALLINDHYEIIYVYNAASKSTPLYLKITALWGGQSGSLLLWCWLMSTFASAVTLRKWDRDAEFLPWVIVVNLVILAFFLGMVIFFENPFMRAWMTTSGDQVAAMFQPAGTEQLIASDGKGLSPMLRHPGMIIHPPLLYLGFVALVIPYAFAIAALITGRTDDRWIRITRRWTLVAWLFLSLGLITGMRWAYDVLGWGGYWSWDPVEIAALMPWLTGTAFLHSVMIQEKRGLFKRWNMILIILTFALVIFGTFLTRSGVLSSVHAFAESSLGPVFFVFIALTFAVSLGLLLYRWPSLASEGSLNSLFSRESLFLVINLLFMGILVVCFWGVIFPLISELITGQKVTIAAPFYEQATGPIFAALLFLMGVAPLSAWGHSTLKTLGRAFWKPFIVSVAVVIAVYVSGVRSWAALLGFWLVALVLLLTSYEYLREAMARRGCTGENYFTAALRLTVKNRRRYGGFIIHIGIVIMSLGIIGIEMFQTETQGTLKVGESLSIGGYRVTYQSLADFDTNDRNVARAVVSVEKNGKNLGELYPRRDYYYDSEEQMTIPGIRSTMEDDVYVILVDWNEISAQSATFKVYHNPLVNWLWVGGMIFLFGVLVAAWPDKEVEPQKSTLGKRAVGVTQSSYRNI